MCRWRGSQVDRKRTNNMNESSTLMNNEHDTAAANWTHIQKSKDNTAASSSSSSSSSEEKKKNGNLEIKERGEDACLQSGDTEREDELFSQHQKDGSGIFGVQWWKGNFFLYESTQFGTWDGVFTSCMINIFGVLIFLRIGWMVGYAGMACTLAIIIVSTVVAFIALSSAVGICQRCYLDQGGIYFLLNHVLGTRVAAPIGVLYCFGQGVACALFMVGFGESISTLVRSEDPWVARGIATLLLLILLAINIAGVKWVIRLQLILLATIAAAVLDFLIGSLVSLKPEYGIVGYSWSNLLKNMGPDEYHYHDHSVNSSSNSYSYLSSLNLSMERTGFFDILGVFFPAVTGVFAGINMSGDLRYPSRSIPTGSFVALGVSALMYVTFAFVLGLTCLRSSLQSDYLIAEKVSGTGLILMCGLYVSSISSGMGSLYGSPKILQCIADDNAFPFLSFLSKSSGRRHPYIALVSIATISLVFILIGSVNALGPIVAVPFILCYAVVDWAYFSLVTSYKRREKCYSSLEDIPEYYAGECYDTPDCKGDLSNEDNNLHYENKRIKNTISPLPKSCYSVFCSRWLSLFGAVISILAMFCIQWFYAIVIIVVFAIMYIYILLANPTVFEGISEFGIKNMTKNLFIRYREKHQLGEESRMVISNDPPPTQVSTAEVTDTNQDYQHREPYHKTLDVEAYQLF